MIKTRFAPSPTGLMHLGNVRTALFNHCLAGREKGVFLLRIEDTDPARNTGEFKRRLGLSGKALFLPLRAALTGRIDGPDLADLIALMPRERVRERFAALIKEP